MKKLYAFIMALFLAPALARAENPAITFVNNTADSVINTILATDAPMDQKLDRFKSEFTQALDLKSIGQFVLGVYWKKATPEEKQAFLDVFMDFTTKVWADRFTLYEGQKLVFTGVRNAERNQLYVDSTFQNNPPVEVIWRLKQKDDSYKIIDIIVEDVSMAITYRNEYTAFLQAHNGSVSELTAELKNKNDTFKWTNTK